ncbi:MAG: type II toxin-antitoxin system VapC family toxin [Gemmatimonadetes bacterium]|jgi:uncharacterized protein|nr:type II toxin-antitoxin system VapC family toxin [Gemmatimonadota bacterium]
MSVFVDTSAFLAILDTDDEEHAAAKRIWEHLIATHQAMVCSSYILAETVALVQRRLGVEAVRTFQHDIYPLLHIKWVDEPIHRAGMAAVIAASRRKLSLVDCVSFEVMRRGELHQVFGFDPHFEEQGFEAIAVG